MVRAHMEMGWLGSATEGSVDFPILYREFSSPTEIAKAHREPCEARGEGAGELL